MRSSIETGISFGLTSGIITTLGLMVGLNAGTGSQLIVIGGILTIAIADAFSDALGIHVSQESEDHTTSKEVWESTFSTFGTKFCFALTFLIPVILFELGMAIVISVIWGLAILGILSYKIAKQQKEKVWKAVVEHMTIALIVIFITHYIGLWIASTFA